MVDYYKIFNLSKNCTQDQIKKAYRKAVIFWHPDKNKSPNAHEKFIQINEAYEILSNEEKRMVYDKIYTKIIKNQQSVITTKKDESNFEYVSHKEYIQFEEWVKEAKKKAQKTVFKTFDDTLTNSFDFINKYGFIIVIILIIAWYIMYID